MPLSGVNVVRQRPAESKASKQMAGDLAQAGRSGSSLINEVGQARHRSSGLNRIPLQPA